ncbi:TRAP transporter small permease [Flexithrix dorotheae]|uniref:TRAP transporter small permease n=1 Tax=Flexithrix dorotheae TaxID=70993 RepID=UPI00035C51D4|nr:TRAP transporter small permease [Flexithrix dorotheae]
MRTIINDILGKFLVFLMALMVINVLLQVAARGLNLSMPFTEELAGFLLIWVGLLGASYATGKHLHLAIDIIPRQSSASTQKRLNVIVNIIVIGFALTVMVIGGIRLVYITLSLNQISPVLEIQKGYIYTVLPISGLLIIYYSFLNMKDNPYTESENV